MGNCQSSESAVAKSPWNESSAAASANINTPRTTVIMTSETPDISDKVAMTNPTRTASHIHKKKSKASTSSLSSSNDPYSQADPSRWKFSEISFAGSSSYVTMGRQDVVEGHSIQTGIEKFKANPDLYVCMTYQTESLRWPIDQQSYTLIHREGTTGYKPENINARQSWMTLLQHHYQRLPEFPSHELPHAHRDPYTDRMTHMNILLHTSTNRPILPGRGMGVGDLPTLKIIGNVDPSDIQQGSVGNCWMLSGISSLAEFDGAIRRLFRKTPNLDQMPLDYGPNHYTITLWDLTTWKEVDVVVDERLAVMADGSGRLLASQPSSDGELWVCYLEKAMAAHCGGWDKITGGQCTHAWALLTGCREQYMIKCDQSTGKFGCYAKFNPNKAEWSRHANAPRDCDGSMWRVPWPKVGGGGDIHTELNSDEVFQQLCAWDAENFIMAASTDGTSDKYRTGGMVDNHAYSVIQCVKDVAGSGIDLIKVRNPWGKGEIEGGMFDDDGPGWARYPKIAKALNPVVADDGIFWVTKQEFFKIFKTIYLSASNMTAFLED